ncbi:MAG: hypothetical protein HC913_13445 [Microscillaceae bacterium]|nr:hypothetical protein [Microscillaceae bacterium]
MWLSACSPEQELPQPQGPWAKVQQWYAQQNALNKNSSTYFHPQWGEGQLQTLADGSQLALFPVHREVAVQYYEVGFVRSLVIHLDAQGEILSGKILEMVGGKAYRPAHKDELAPKHWEGVLLINKALAWDYFVNLNLLDKSGGFLALLLTLKIAQQILAFPNIQAIFLLLRIVVFGPLYKICVVMKVLPFIWPAKTKRGSRF